jgi:hypothetical protein
MSLVMKVVISAAALGVSLYQIVFPPWLDYAEEIYHQAYAKLLQ